MNPSDRPRNQIPSFYRSDSALLRSLHGPSSNGASHGQRAANNSSVDWTTWPELSVKVHDLPPHTRTADVSDWFGDQGQITSIRVFKNNQGQCEGKAIIRFRYARLWPHANDSDTDARKSPPPERPFWQSGRYSIVIKNKGTIAARVHLEPRKQAFKQPSPINAQKTYEEIMTLNSSSLDFGIMVDPATMMTMCSVYTTPIQFRVNLFRREIVIEFLLEIRDQRPSHVIPEASLPQLDKKREFFRFRIPFSQLETIHSVDVKNHTLNLLLTLETPPKFFKKLDPRLTHDDDADYWTENDAWYRQTDIVYNQAMFKKSPLTLKKTRPIIDLGRWTTYRIALDETSARSPLFDTIRQALQDYNIEIKPFGHLHITDPQEPPVWAILDKPTVKQQQQGVRADLIELDESPGIRLAFAVRYQLEVCISNGLLSEYNLDQDFISRLAGMPVDKAQDLLEYVANQGRRIFDPMSLFRLSVTGGAALRASIPHYCVYVRSATVTPTTVYFQTPVPETSNRVIRGFTHYADRFLRVRFTEEKTEGKIYATDKDTMNEVFTRVKRVLANGIVIGDHKYEFLACGNSQFREHGAYFFAPLPHLTTEKMRDWMGLFSEIKTVPLYLARLGQCFSTTRAIQSAKTEVKEMDDIERNGYNFSDGVGKISPFLAHLAASELGILQHLDEPPSVYQIRAGGCKGVLAQWPTPGATEIYIRRSQYKFPAPHEGLEIIRWSQYACANLNRQLILILSALGVPDDVFSQKLRLQLSNLEKAMTDEKTALAILQKDIDHNQMTLTLASMVLDGFQRTEEPFMTSLLQLWRAWSIKYLKEKARITISDGGLLLGCVDETGKLKGHFENTPTPPNNAPINEKIKSVPEVFVQISKNAQGKPEVITGPMLLARNPSLHPGDIRVVCGTDIPELRHLKDVVVLPQTGDRDIASMCSGGDLDGDDFLAIWDKDLLPYEWNVEPMDYARPPMVQHMRDIHIGDLTSFFVTYMKNDSLSRIAQAHLANADFLDAGVRDERCLKLANLHSMAVDYVKTGQPARMPRDLRPQKRPHFMDNTYQRKENTYISHKVLGQLYDQVERVDFSPRFATPFDHRILRQCPTDEGLFANVKSIKKDYDAHMRRIMAQHEIKTEFEVWSTFVLEHSKTSNDYKFHEQIGQISAALKDQFRGLCYEQAGGKTFEHTGPFVAAMYKVTADEMSQAVQECSQTESLDGQQRPLRKMTAAEMPLMSFPWLFQNVLGKLANSSEQKGKGERSGNVDTIAAQNTARPTHVRRARAQPNDLLGLGDLETAEGTTHPGDLLQLFEDSHIQD
ncbi:hypothetical protein ACLMJK_008998 [Lecanora helva]